MHNSLYLFNLFRNCHVTITNFIVLFWGLRDTTTQYTVVHDCEEGEKNFLNHFYIFIYK